MRLIEILTTQVVAAGLSIVAATAATAQPDLQFRQGRAAFNNGQWDQAIARLRPWWNSGKRDYRTAYYIGTSYCQKPLYGDGRAWLDHALSRFAPPSYPAGIIREARIGCKPVPPPPMTIQLREWSRSAELLYMGADRRQRARPLSGERLTPVETLTARRVALGQPTGAVLAGLRDALARPTGASGDCARGGQVKTYVIGRYLFVTRVGTGEFVLKSWADRMDALLVDLDRRLGLRPPADYITVHLARCPGDAAKIAKALHGLEFDATQMAGYSVHDDLSILATFNGDMAYGDTQTMRTLRHELTHLVARGGFGDIPDWLDEGLAQYIGVTSGDPETGRTTILPSTWGDLPRLDQMVGGRLPGLDDPNPVIAGQCIADEMMRADVARMFVAYVDAQDGRLRRLLEVLRGYVPAGGALRTDRQLIEAALGAPLPEIQRAMESHSTIRRGGDTDRLFSTDAASEVCAEAESNPL